MSNQATSSGISFTGLLFITFLVLKLTHVIDWAWLWVTAPLWGGLALALGTAAIILLSVGVVAAVMSVQLWARGLVTARRRKQLHKG